METLDALEKVSVDEKYRPIQEVKIKSVTILANPSNYIYFNKNLFIVIKLLLKKKFKY